MRRIILVFCVTTAVGASAMGGQAHAAEAVNAELIRLHDDLKLTDSQDAAWRRYATAIAPDPQALARRRATEALLPTVPTPRRIALIEASMAQDTADFRRQGAAVSAFYATLTPDQQRVFDEDTLPRTNDTRPEASHP